MNSKNYARGWDMWFDDGTDTPAHYSGRSMDDLKEVPKDGLQAWVVHLDGVYRYNVTGDVQFCAPHPAGGLIISGVGNGTMTIEEMEKAKANVEKRYPGAICIFTKNTTFWIHKQARDAASEARLPPIEGM